MPATEDRALVAAIVSGDPHGLDGAYRRYAARLYAYSRTLLSDGEAAADVVQDTFMIAARQVGQLRDADRLSAWLYAIARNECRRHARASARHVPLDALDSTAGDPAADTPDPAAALHAHQTRELVHAAAAGLGDGDREVIDLALRHGLAAADLADVLGVPLNHVHARLSRARTALERCIGILLVARDGGRDCPALAGLLFGWDGHLTPLLRKRLGRHVDGCPTCSGRRGRLASPAALLAAYVAGPFTLAAGVHALPEPDGMTLVGREVPLDPRTGFPRRRLLFRRRTAAAVAAVLALLTVGAVTAIALATGGPDPDAGLVDGRAGGGNAPAERLDRSPGTPPQVATSVVSPSSADSGIPGDPVPSGSGAPSAPAGPGASSGSAGAGIAGVPGGSDEPFAVRVVNSSATCTADGRWTVTVAATGTRPVQSATLVTRAARGAPPPARTTLQVDGSTLSGTTAPARGIAIEWWIEATATDAATATTPPTMTTTPCRPTR